MTTVLNLNELAPILAGRMLNSVAEGLVIGLFAWVLLRVMGRRNSSTRFAVWFSALLAIAAVPVFSLTGPHSTSAARVTTAITIPSSWALTVLAMWAMIASVSLARVGIGLWQLRKLRASCSPVDTSTLDPVARETLHRFHPARSVQLCESDRVRVPTAIGFLKPLVVIPSWAMQELTPAELNSILIHELAHLRRWDDWTNLAQQVLKAFLFFHPAVWWIENKLALEREMACDDAVLAETVNPRGYAQCLISMAEKSFMRRGVAMAQAIVNRVHQTSLRVSQILDVNRPAATRVWKPALYSVAAFSVVCLVSLPRAPELVAFEDVPNVMASAVTSVGIQPAAAVANLSPREALATRVNIRVRKAGSLVQPGKTVLTRRSSPRQDSATPMQAKFNQPGVNKDVPVKTAEFIQDGEAPRAIFVVMQTEEYRQAGPILWRLCVWHVVVFDSSHTPAGTRIPAKQI
jgi:beta-lactamase regulating signal transducer with metallopeptidase domain